MTGEGRLTRTGQAHWRVWRTDIRDGSDLEIDDSNTDKRRDERGDHLGGKGVPRRDLGVVSDFEVARECQRVGAGHIAKGLWMVSAVHSMREHTRDRETY